MNYKKIHDDIINRATQRKITTGWHESHHIIPKCEGGLEEGEQVYLTVKEHYIIHKLRYKFTGVIGNLIAYNLMKYGRSKLIENHKIIAKLGGKTHHEKYKKINYEKYVERQTKSGLLGGLKCKEDNIGFFQLSEEQKQTAREKGRKTLVDKKIGMFSDEYRIKHRLTLMKKVKTPDGIFDSLTEASEYYKISRSLMTYRIKSEKYKEWFLL